MSYEDERKHWRSVFEVQKAARDLGRSIISGGGYRGAPYHGAVVATTPEGSRVSRQDSWRCHHRHSSDLTALACALEEVRRLAAGGNYLACSSGRLSYDDCDRHCAS